MKLLGIYHQPPTENDNEYRLFCRWLKEHHIYTRYCRNRMSQNIVTKRYLLRSAFIWDGTPEGWFFWHGADIIYGLMCCGAVPKSYHSRELANCRNNSELFCQLFPESVNYI